MFLQVTVILLTGGGGCLVPGGCLLPGGVLGGDPPRTATAAGGTHPTGMHSCLPYFCKPRISRLADSCLNVKI